MPTKLERCFNIDDLQALGRSRTPRAIFDYADGGADDEVTLKRNASSYADYDLIPNVLRDVSNIDLSTRVLGTDLKLPFALSPTGGTRMFHPGGEKAVAKAAARAGTAHTLSSVGTTNIETFAKAADGPKWFQIYVWRDRAINSAFIQRCREAGYKALMLTVDVPVGGNRERDLHNQLSFPPKPNASLTMDLLAHPGWALRFFTGGRPKLANIPPEAVRGLKITVMEFINSQFDQTVTWDDAAQMIAEWGGPFAIKGIQNAEDAKRAVAAGASAIVVSNHGGRQLDGVPATIEMLEEIVAAVDGRAEVILDGGIRRGTDMLKALALGADACMIGRPYLFGLCAGGEKGVSRALNLLEAEVRRGMALLGAQKIADLRPSMVRRRK